MNNVLEVDHPVIDIYLTALRDKTTKTASFRRAMANIGNILAYHALSELPLTEFEVETPLAELPMGELTLALAEVMQRVEQSSAHLINYEQLSTRERMSEILERMRNETFIEFSSLFKVQEGKIGVVVTFLAVLELLKDSLVEIVQSEEFGPIHIKGIDELH